MALRYLLDTNIVSDLVRNPQGAAASQISINGEDTVCTSIVVAAELRYGAEKSGSKKLADRINLILSALDILPLAPPADRHYGEIRHRLTKTGTPISGNDMLIAAHGLSVDLTLVTANVREFSHVPGLRVENWLSD